MVGFAAVRKAARLHARGALRLVLEVLCVCVVGVGTGGDRARKAQAEFVDEI